MYLIMKSEQLVIFEDNKDIRALLELNALLRGHMVIKVADNLEMANVVLHEIEKGALTPHPTFGITDYNLREGDHSCSDGRYVAERLLHLGIPAVGFSAVKPDENEPDIPVAAYIDKAVPSSVDILFNAIEELRRAA